QIVLDLAASDGFSALALPALSPDGFTETYRIFDGKQGDTEIRVAEAGAGTVLDHWLVSQGGKTVEKTGQSIKLPIDRNTRIEAVFRQA
ncbi:MAG: hypothetical protein ABIY39_11865, partial [Sphingomonas sp.]